MSQTSDSAPTVVNPLQPLLDLVASLNRSARSIDSFIDAQADPYSQLCQQLRTKEQAIVDSANDLSNLAIQQITQSISDAVTHLKNNIDAAAQTITDIQDATKVITIVAAVLAAAAGIASGGSLAAVPAILTLASQVYAALATTTN
jgi:hypothetical protein